MSGDDQPRWLELEEWLIEHEGEEFTVAPRPAQTWQGVLCLSEEMGIHTTTATRLVQGYLLAQRGPKSETVYMLKRRGRTKNAVWSFGKRVYDAQQLDRVLYEDVLVKVHRDWKPDMKRLAELNPKLAKRYERKVEALLGGALVMLRTVLDDAIASEEGG